MSKSSVMSIEDITSQQVFLGIDPDMRNVSFVFLGKGVENEEANILCACVKIPTEMRGEKVTGIECLTHFLQRSPSLEINAQDAFCSVEYPNVRRASSKAADPQDLIHIAAMAGALAGFVVNTGGAVEMVLPEDWKGSCKKTAHQARICKAVGWDYHIHETKNKKQIIPDLSPFRGTPIKFSFISQDKDGNPQQKDREPNIGEWEDILDSLGLALHAARSYKVFVQKELDYLCENGVEYPAACRRLGVKEEDFEVKKA